jgi:hypothetical protein
MGALLNDAKSKSWFVHVLNGSGLLPRNLSNLATMDCLLTGRSDSCNDLEAAAANQRLWRAVLRSLRYPSCLICPQFEFKWMVMELE